MKKVNKWFLVQIVLFAFFILAILAGINGLLGLPLFLLCFVGLWLLSSLTSLLEEKRAYLEEFLIKLILAIVLFVIGLAAGQVINPYWMAIVIPGALAATFLRNSREKKSRIQVFR